MTRKPESDNRLTRRAAIRHVSALFGGVALVGHRALLEAAEAGAADADAAGSSLFSPSELALLDEVAETVLPETGTPGAKAAGVGPFVALMVADAYSPAEQAVFRAGIRTLETECRAATGGDFLVAAPDARRALLERFDREQLQYMQGRPDSESHADGEAKPAHWFRMMKELILLGYFTSEIGYTKAMRFRETPGRYDPCVPYEAGDKAWARHA